MMLYVNGEEITELVLGICEQTPGGFSWRFLPRKYASSPETYLQMIDAYLTEQSLASASLTGILLASGDGSATALRSIHAIMNTFALTQGLPLFFVKKMKLDTDEDVLMKDIQGPFEGLFPEYGKAPHITVTEKDSLKR